MLSVSEELKQAFFSAEQKNLILTFDDGTVIDNSNIAFESMDLEQSISDGDELKFGQTSSACFKTKIKSSEKRYKNLWFNASIGVGEHTIKLGRFKVYTDNMTSDRLYRDIVAYDSLFWIANTDVTDWYNGLTFPISLKAFRDSLFDFLGIEQEPFAHGTDFMMIQKTIGSEKIQALMVIQKICELSATFGVINVDGKFKQVSLHTEFDETLYNNSYYQGTLHYEEYDTRPITKVTIREDPDDLGYSYGEDGNTYVIENNFLLYGANDTYLSTTSKLFYEKTKNFYYTPSELVTKGAPWREVGDFLIVETGNHSIRIPIFNRRLKGITALKDTYTARGTETYGETRSSYSEQIKKLQSRTNKLTRTLDGTKSEITRVETETKEYADSVATNAVESANKSTDDKLKKYSTTTEMNSAISQKADEITSTVSKSQTKWIIDEEKFTVDIYGYGIPSNDTAKDNLGINYLNMETGWIYTVITNGEIFVWQPMVKCEKVQEDIYSKIEQNAEKISQKVSNGDVVSEINQSADTIELKGDRIIVESTKWKVNENGSQTCSDLTITGGNVNLESNTTAQTKLRVAFSNYESSIFAGNISTNSDSGTVTLYADGYMLINSNYGTGGNVFYIADHRCTIGSNEVVIANSFLVKGTKSRLADTETYGNRLLYCYETPSPMFGDIGEGKIDETGKCYIFLDDIFGETIDTDCVYQVFLQPYGKGECYVTERTSSYFIVEGTENLAFGWELKAIQRDFDTMRLEEYQEQERQETDVLSETYGYLTTLLYNPETEEIENE